ncbi:hypothetical protein PISMIDRAFT_680136, partial [Pisolithus microcarpus 441]
MMTLTWIWTTTLVRMKLCHQMLSPRLKRTAIPVHYKRLLALDNRSTHCFLYSSRTGCTRGLLRRMRSSSRDSEPASAPRTFVRRSWKSC